MHTSIRVLLLYCIYCQPTFVDLCVKQTCVFIFLCSGYILLVYLFVFGWQIKRIKQETKEKEKNARNQYTSTKRTVLSEQNNDTTATAELSSPTVTQIPTEIEDDIGDLNQSASFQKLNKSYGY